MASEQGHTPKMMLRDIRITICNLCLDGEGGECHTPGCAFWLHEMESLPVNREQYEILAEFDPLGDAPCVIAKAQS